MTHPPTPTPWSSHAVVWLAAAALALAPVSIFAVQIACLLLVIVALPHIPRRIWRSERALLIAIGLVAAAWLLSWSMSPVGPRAFYEAKDLWAVLLLPAVIAVRHLLWPRRHMLMMALALGLVVALAWSCVQLATGRDYIRGVSLQAEWGANWRPTGFYHSAMTFGGMSALCICAFGAFTFAPGVGLRQRALHGLALVAAVAALIISGSRSYQIALPILVVVWGVSRGRKGLIAAWSALVVGTTVVVMAGPAMLGMGRFEMPALQYTPDPQAPTVFSITTPPTQDERIPLWTVGLECINDHPWTGTGKGPAGYNATIEPYIEQFHDRTGVKLLRNHLHNNYLQVLVETGVIGLFAVGTLVLVLLWRWTNSWRVRARAQAPAPTVVAGVVVVLLVSGLFEYSVGDLELFLLGSLLLGLCHPPPRVNVPLSTAERLWYSWRRFGTRGVLRRLLHNARGGPAVAHAAVAAPIGDDDTLNNTLRASLAGFLSNPDARLRFPPVAADAAPRVSIIIPTCNTDYHLLQVLQSVAAHTSDVSYEVVVVDDASADRTPELTQRVEHMQLVRHDVNREFVVSCNDGAAVARGELLLLLNSDTTVTPGWLSSLVRRLDSDPATVGAVCSKLVWPDGRLQQAGSIVWNDGGTFAVGSGGDPLAAEYGEVRDVDFGAAACLLVRRDLYMQLGGFDTAYAPAYYEDVDLCFRLRELGFRTLYEPRSTVIHHEIGSRDAGSAARHCMRNQVRFVARHAAALKAQQPYGNVAAARDRRGPGQGQDQ